MILLESPCPSDQSSQCAKAPYFGVCCLDLAALMNFWPLGPSWSSCVVGGCTHWFGAQEESLQAVSRRSVLRIQKRIEIFIKDCPSWQKEKKKFLLKKKKKEQSFSNSFLSQQRNYPRSCFKQKRKNKQLFT